MTDEEKIELAVLKNSFEQWTLQHDAHSMMRHAETNKKFDLLFEKLDEVPCRKVCKNEATIARIWAVMLGLILALAGAYFKK